MGLLLIVEHDAGYLSLYGHARELLMEPGDWVDVGDVVGTVGDSGGRKRSGLYFGIRRGTNTEPEAVVSRFAAPDCRHLQRINLWSGLTRIRVR